MHHLMELLQSYGYIIVFLWTLLEGETIVILAGFAAHQGYLKLEYIIPIAVVGAIIGDQFFFYLGRWKGPALLARWPNLNKRLAHAHDLTEHYHGWIIFGSRFMYGFRTIIPISFGMAGVSARRFFTLNLLGAIVWAILFAGGGYIFGTAVERFLGHAKRVEARIVLGILLCALLFQLYMWWKRSHEEGLSAVDESPSGKGK